MSRKLPLAEGEASRTACVRALVHKGMDEETGEALSQAVLAQRVGGRWNAADVDVLASGQDAGGRRLPSQAWMALRRLGWTVTAPAGVKVNDRIVRMA